MQEILPLVLNGGDLTPIQTIPNWDRVPWLEEKRLALVVDQLPSPRAMVTHFPYHLMPPSLHTSRAKVSFLHSHPATKSSFKKMSFVWNPFIIFVNASGDLRHEKPKGCSGLFLLLPPNGFIPPGSRNIWRIYDHIPGGQRSHI